MLSSRSSWTSGVEGLSPSAAVGAGFPAVLTVRVEHAVAVQGAE